MIRMYSAARARRAVESEADEIRAVAEKFGLPPAWIQAVLLKELTEMDILDPLADLAVRLYHARRRLTGRAPHSESRVFGKKDSSTGWAQIYGFVAIDAANFAADRGIADYAALGIDSDHRLNKEDLDDLWMIWKRLNTDRRFNIEMAAVNLLSCAEEMTGRFRVGAFTPEETKLTFTRYNGRLRQISPYAEAVYRNYQDYLGQKL